MDRSNNVFILGLIAMVVFMVAGIATQSSHGKAETETLRFESDFEIVTVSSCGGDELQLGGTANFVFHETISADGSKHESSHMNYQKTDGYGLQSGKRYQLNEANHATVQLDEDGEKHIVHSVITGTLIGQGPLTNTGVVINLLTVFDDDGSVKTSVEKVDL